MRAFLACMSALLCGFLLIGAVGLNAPIMQSQSYYINDHAGVIGERNSSIMLQTAQELYENTGVRMVMVTVENLDGRTPEEYAELLFRSWEIGSGGIGILMLLSIEEKCFATWSNADISLTPSIMEANTLAGTEQFDLAAATCFASILDSIDSTDLVQTAPEIVHSEASVMDEHKTQASQDTRVTQATETRISSILDKDIMIMLLILIFIFISMRARANSMKRRKQMAQSENMYLRKTYSYYDAPIAVRIDDLDYPTGFGGLGNRKAIYFEDVDEADDIGIIKRKSPDSSDG